MTYKLTSSEKDVGWMFYLTCLPAGSIMIRSDDVLFKLNNCWQFRELLSDSFKHKSQTLLTSGVMNSTKYKYKSF